VTILKYHGATRKLIEAIKYEYIFDAIPEMAELMVKKLKKNYPNVVKYWKKEKYTIVPVPLYWQRENWRGFNQSQKLAEIVARKLKLAINSQVIIRTKNTQVQAKIIKRDLRKSNVENSFQIREGEKIPKNIIIFDDVITSGATLRAIQKILKKSPNHCWGLTLAQARR